jgi:hypothetical protein
MLNGIIPRFLVVVGTVSLMGALSPVEETATYQPDLIGFKSLHVLSSDDIQGEVKSSGVSLEKPHHTGAMRSHEQVYWDSEGKIVGRMSIHQFNTEEKGACLAFSQKSWDYLGRKESLTFTSKGKDTLKGPGDAILERQVDCDSGLLRYSLYLKDASHYVTQDWGRTPSNWNV